MVAKGSVYDQAVRQMTPKRGEVYLVNFDPTIGSEIKKTRPAVIIQNNISNKHSTVTIVAAITSSDGSTPYPNEVFVKSGEGGLDKDSFVLLNQVRTVDGVRLIKKLGVLKAQTIGSVDRAIEISLGLGEL